MTVATESPRLDVDAAARGAAYALFAAVSRHPTEELHGALESGAFRADLSDLVDRTPLDVSVPVCTAVDDYDTLCARYNDVFVLGYSEYENPMDGTLDTTEPPAPLYESAYRTDASWNDVNLDLARAYDYYGLSPDEDERQHHDHLTLQLEFAGYLARREATVDGEDAAAARLDFLDRHLSVLVAGVTDRVRGEAGTGVYQPLVCTLERLVESERADLGARLEGER
ncbi:MAG: molecular chaperone TorD family protein [Haloarculaceae archaeon]